jgi:hypothetical protein
MTGIILIIEVTGPQGNLFAQRSQGLAAATLGRHLARHNYTTRMLAGMPQVVSTELAEIRTKKPVIAAVFVCGPHNMAKSTRLSQWIAEHHAIPVILCCSKRVRPEFKAPDGTATNLILCDPPEQNLVTLLDNILTKHLNGTPSPNTRRVAGIASSPRRNLRKEDRRSAIPHEPIWINEPERSYLPIYTGTGMDFEDLCCYPRSDLPSKKFRSMPHVIAELRQTQARVPDLKFIHILDNDFLADKSHASQFSRALDHLRGELDFVWCCNCSVGSLIESSTLVAEMAANGLVRVEMAIEYKPPDGAASGNANVIGVDVQRAVAICVKAGISQISGHVIMQQLPRDSDELHHLLAWAETLLVSAPGEFEFDLNPLLPNKNLFSSDFHDGCCLKLKNMLALDDLGSSSDLPGSPARHWPAVIQKEFRRHVKDVMRRMVSSGRISKQTLLSHFLLYQKNNIESVWLKDVLKQYGVLFNYYSLIADGAVHRSSDIEPSELIHWRPQRTMDLWLVLDTSKGYPRIGGYVLSPLEYELLLYSSGKLTLSQLMQTAYAKFGSRFDDYSGFHETALSKLKAFEERHWLVYAEI